jgi:cullin 1
MSRFPNSLVSSRDGSHETWKKLEAGVDKIMNKLQDGMNMKEYMELYTSVHNFCTAQKPSGSGGFNAQTHNRGGAHLLGEELYNHLTTYLNEHLELIRDASQKHAGEELLRYYIREWKRYTTAAEYNNHLFRYLNRHWVKREMDEGKKNVFDIYTLHLVRWKEAMFMHCHKQVMDAVLKLVEKQRDGETIDHTQIKTLVQSFVSLGLDDSDSTKNNLDVYRQFFETPFLKATHDYYENESKKFLVENSVVEYMKKAESRLDEEKNRIDLYLLPDIQIPLMRTCEAALIRDHSGMLRDEFQLLLDNDKLDDLGRMYKLLSRIPEGLDPLRSKFEEHVKKSGLQAVEKSASGSDTADPRVYVTTLLTVHLQYKGLVDKAFEGEANFVKSLDNACRSFVNTNKVANGSSGKQSSRTPELLSKYTDSLMKRSGAKMSEEDDMEKCQDEVMTIFKYIDDKDVFQTFYRRALSKRLVHATSSEDHETSMISKLKETCGFEYTNKLQRMFQDVQISKDLNSQYRDWAANLAEDESTGAARGSATALDSYFMILASGMWPLTTPNTPFTAPPALQTACDRFLRFYQNKHSGRKLTWIWNMGKGEIRCNFAKYNNKHPYQLTVSAFQMGILLLFEDNNSDSLTYDQIMTATQLNKDNLEPQLKLFLKARLMTSTLASESESPVPETVYTLNRGFKSKKIKINLNVPLKSETKQEMEETQKYIEEDRRILIQMAIVRVMKTRKQLKHQNLMSETISQVKKQFAPKMSEIKKCVEILIEKEYLERLDDDLIGYLA